MKTKLLVMMLLASSAAFARTHFNIGIGVNVGPAYPVGGYYAAPPPPPPPVAYMPASPGPGYVWVQGYWGYVGNRYVWNNGYWNQPAYAYGYGNRGGQRYRGGRGHGRDRDWDDRR